MKAAIFKPKWYTDYAYHKLEQDNLFDKVWLYMGLVSDLKNSGDYFVVKIADKEIVLHRLQKEIYAYLNVCPHRGGPLVMDKFGNAQPVCKYHGWSFRSAGELTGVSNLNWFNHDSDNGSCGRKLNQYSVKVVGPAVFVFLGKEPIPFENQYGIEVITALAGIGLTSDSIVTEFQSPINWKLNIENVKDFLHPYYVHAETFRPLLNYAVVPTERIEGNTSPLSVFNEEVNLVDLSYVLQGDFSVSAEGQWWFKYIKTTQKNNCYQNIFLFPNANFCSVSGAHYVVQQYLPETEESFNYRLTVALPEVIEKFESKEALFALLKIERDVIKEDDVVLTKVQNNMRANLSSEHYSHGDYEAHIMRQMKYLSNEVYYE